MVERDRRGAVLDGAAVAVLVLAAAGSVPLAYLGGGRPGGVAVAVVWAVAGLQVVASPLVLGLRRWPVGAAAAVAAVVVAGLVPAVVAAGPLAVRFGAVDCWPPLALSGAVIAVRRHAPHRRATAVWALIAAATVLAARPWQPSWAVTPVGLLHTAVPALLGLYLASRWQVLNGLRERAEQAERERLLLADRARAEERARLAAELHDSVAHRVSLMVLQAGALRLTSPDQATRDAAEHLRATGCQALEELSELLGVLRRPEAPEVAAAEPSTVEAALAGLVAESVAVGLPVVLDEAGDPAAVPAVVRRTAYRVVQEALTNVHKHAPGAEVAVTARYGPDQVLVRVRNEDAAAPAAGAGLPVTTGGTGLLGLRRRVEAIGGSLRAGPAERDGAGRGGFLVEATMPGMPGTPGTPGREVAGGC